MYSDQKKKKDGHVKEKRRAISHQKACRGNKIRAGEGGQEAESARIHVLVRGAKREAL